MTVFSLVSSAGAMLAKAGVETPRLDAEVLLAASLRITRSALLAHREEVVTAEAEYAYHAAIARRIAGESAAVITGRKEFRYLEFMVSAAVLVPRPETETLVEAALEKIVAHTGNGNRVSVLDICAGSGAVGLSLKHEAPWTEVVLADISGPALDIARQNAARHNLEAAFVQSDLFSGIDGTFDIIVSNPPYVRSSEIASLSREVRHEPRLALDGGDDGLALIRRIVAGSGERLRDGGFLLMEADPREMSAITALLSGNGYTDTAVRKDLSGNDRVICARRPAG
jgi:release factor glutamine methyltransferase